MNITIVFPPAADPSLPYGALALLFAAPTRAGHQDIALHDLNLEAFDDLFQPALLSRTAHACRDLVYREGGPDASAAARRATRALSTAEEVVHGIANARRILRDP